MSKIINSLLLVLIIVVFLSLFVGVKNNNNKLSIVEYERIYDYINDGNDDLHITIEIEDEGQDVYVPQRVGYRYGPSIIINDDGSMDAFFATPGNGYEWDWITYRHSNDGITWGKEQIVLRPSKKSLDAYSVCDPGVIYFNGYYYLGYTSTTNKNGVENNIFVARSKNVNGPYEKWNGEGWGGNPSPIIEYDDEEGCWGAGEISFVIVNEKLYCYYSWINEEGSFTKLAIADTNDENWPANLKHKGKVYTKQGDQDSCDVVYVKELNKFLAICTMERLSEKSSIGVYESNDGLTFYKASNVKEGVLNYCHNIGISKHLDGNVSINDDLLVGYAYGLSEKSWGKWSTRFQKINLVFYVEKLSKSN